MTDRCGEENERHNQQRRVENVEVLVTLGKELLLLVVPLLHDVFVQSVSGLVPGSAARAWKRTFLREANTWEIKGSGVMPRGKMLEFKLSNEAFTHHGRLQPTS